MEDKTRISPYSVYECEAPEEIEFFGAYNVLERFDYFDLLRILPEGNYTTHRVTSVFIGDTMKMTVAVDVGDFLDMLCEVRFHGDGLIDIYAPAKTKGWIVAKYDDHNWHIVNNSPSRIFTALMDSFIKEWKKMNVIAPD